MTRSTNIPKEHESNNVVTSHSYLPSYQTKPDEALMDSGYSNHHRYTTPVVPSRSPTSQYSGPQAPYISSYYKQASTPPLYTSPHTQAGSDKLQLSGHFQSNPKTSNYTQPIYSGPQIVTSPQHVTYPEWPNSCPPEQNPLKSSYSAGDLVPKQENQLDYMSGYTPRKNSRGSVKFSLSSEPSSPPVHYYSTQPLSETDELSVEIEHKKQIKAKLIQEVAHLGDQKTSLEKELKDLKSELDTLKRGYEQNETELDMLQVQCTIVM